MGTPGPTIRSLEKIALFGGKIRDLPSWHHFSIRERVDTLLRTLREPGLIRRHNRFVVGSFLIYLVLLGGLTYLLNFSNVKQNMGYNFIVRLLNQQILDEPENIAPYLNLAVIYHEAGRHTEAIKTYEKIIEMDPQQAPSLNNLAWLLVTTPKLELRDKERALNLAKKAVALETSPVSLDTLAEAYYANGLIREAVRTIEKAIAIATEDKGYYKRQLKKFLAAEESS
jgi:tetratricopeptide (TPR) repeat protein